MKKYISILNSVVALVGFGFASDDLVAATITVTSTADTTAVDGAVTLREAIVSINNGANVNADVVAVGSYGSGDLIDFAIPAAGVQTILLPAGLPAISKSLTIDGYSQPSAIPNSNPPGLGNNAVLLIQLQIDGGGLAVTGGSSVLSGLVINGAAGGVQLTTLGGNTLSGNFIGTNAVGTAAGPHGVFALIDVLISSDSPNNIINGNVLSGTSTGSSSNYGILINSSGNQVRGNWVGTNAAGNAALANDIGIFSFGGTGNNVIGGTSAAQRNIISGNRLSGIELPTSGNQILGNFIGTNVSGTAAIGNGNFGIVIGSSGNTIGGTVAGAGNVISGNTNLGLVFAVGSTGNTVQGNFVGTDASGSAAIGGHVVAGIDIDDNNNVVGGTAAGAANTVAFNAGVGVRVSGGTGSSIQGNRFFSNADLGIKLGQGNGFNVNDAGDADTGPNNVQNYPVLTAASVSAGNATVSGTLNSNVSTTFRLEFFANAACDSLTHGEGQTFIGFANVATDNAGNASFGPLVFAAPAGQAVITATATDPSGNTSEFSQCLTAGAALPTLAIDNVGANEGNAGTTPFTFNVTLSAVSAATVTVNYASADGTATAGSDYAAISGSVIFAPGTTTQPVTVLVNGDVLVEPNETFVVNLTAPTNATVAVAQGTGTIINDDTIVAAGTLQFSAPTYSVGEAGGSAAITVTRAGGSGGAVTVTAASIAGGSATAGADYATTSLLLTWADGDVANKTFSIPIVDDALIEPAETVNLALSAPTGGAALGAPATAVLTIIDNDVATPSSVQSTPTLSTWALLLLTGLLIAASALPLHERKKKSAQRLRP
jgi:Calx-beta domain